MSAIGYPEPPPMRCNNDASVKGLRSPSSTPDGLVLSTPVHKSLTADMTFRRLVSRRFAASGLDEGLMPEFH